MIRSLDIHGVSRWLSSVARFNRDSALLRGSAIAILLLYPCVGIAQEEGIQRVSQVLLEELIEGPFGALVMIVAGLVAIVSAAMGAYRAAMSCLIVAIGAFTLRTFVEIFFGPDAFGG
ncbi:MAG: hypothetical protein IT290_08425 [Deltaproteobacteria bacterium]|nr:hypothetical protein [Deltaproteobacteria bacterium]